MFQVIRYRLRQDALPLLFYLLTFLIMSYPFIFHMQDHLPMDNVDTHQVLWQNWWVQEVMANGGNIHDVPLLFYPAGLDYTLQPPRWPSMLLWMIFYRFLEDPLAYNLTVMCGILIKAYGMYLFGLWLFKRRIPAWVTGAFYAFAATNLQLSLQQQFSGATEWIPWFMLAFCYGVTQIKQHPPPRRMIGIMILAGFLFAMNIFSNLKIGIFAMLLGGGFVVLCMIVQKLWRLPMFWIAMIVFSVSAVGFSSPILIPILQSNNLEDAIDGGVVLRGGVDILSYVKAEHRRPYNYMQSIASLRGEQLQVQNIWGMSHVGIVSIAFALMGLQYAIRVDRKVLIWVILAGVFWILSLGLEFRYNRHLIDFYWTPYRLLEDNIIFLTLKWPFRMSLLFLFPYSILVGYGLRYRLQSLDLNRTQIGLLILSVSMLLYGTSIFPIPMRPAPRPTYIDVLANLSDGAVIDLPFGRHNAKYYMSVQRFHQRPMIEGMIARTPPDAYDYIDANSVLSVIRSKTDLVLADVSADDWTTAFQQLWDDGFRYVILHKLVPQALSRIEYPKAWVVELFASFPPIYEDDEVLIYAINLLQSGTRMPSD